MSSSSSSSSGSKNVQALQTRAFESTLSHWQGTTERGRVPGVDDMITMMLMMTVKVLVMTGVVLHHVFLLWSQDKINERVLPESFENT